jgi:hypothetical protein
MSTQQQQSTPRNEWQASTARARLRQAYTPRDRHIQRGAGTYSERRASTKKRRRTFERRSEQRNNVYNHGDPVAIGNFLAPEGRVS